MRLLFDRGTVLLRGSLPEAGSLPGVLWDNRVGAWRAPAFRYADLVREFKRRRLEFRDSACQQLAPPPAAAFPDLRPYQAAALAAWEVAGCRGIIALPTGSGKTRTALSAIVRSRLRTFCIVPTRVLMAQWVRLVGEAGLGPVGQYGDGCGFEQPVTVATFASALLHAETLGNRFDLLVIDEIHHFGSGAGDEVLEMYTAAARLGLTATPPEDAARRGRLEVLVGPEVYRATVEQLAGRYLASFRLITISVGFVASERQAYEAEMSVFRPLCRAFFDAAPAASWSDFVAAAGKSDAGRRALSAWRRSRAIVRYTSEKRAVLRDLFLRHRASRILVFAADNDTAYAIAREHLIQPITCDVGSGERTQALQRFFTGALRILVSARVLNEGMDLPAADIAIVVGGSQGSREYIQRVGRVLRPSAGKEALVYDLVTRGTFEVRHLDEHRRALASG